MKGSLKIRERDRGLASIMARFKKTPSYRVKVGVQGPQGEAVRSGNLTNAGLAAVHEFGSPGRGIPERSFLRSTFDENQRRYAKELEGVAGKALEGAALEGELLLLGEGARADVIDKIRSNIPPALQPATIARKGGEATALIDTGQLLGSISVVVEKGR